MRPRPRSSGEPAASRARRRAATAVREAPAMACRSPAPRRRGAEQRRVDRHLRQPDAQAPRDAPSTRDGAAAASGRRGQEAHPDRDRRRRGPPRARPRRGSGRAGRASGSGCPHRRRSSRLRRSRPGASGGECLEGEGHDRAAWRPPVSATKPTPHASCSCWGSYRGAGMGSRRSTGIAGRPRAVRPSILQVAPRSVGTGAVAAGVRSGNDRGRDRNRTAIVDSTAGQRR